MAHKNISACQGRANRLNSTSVQSLRDPDLKFPASGRTANRQPDRCSRFVLRVAGSRGLLGQEIGPGIFYFVFAALDHGPVQWQGGTLHTGQCVRFWNQYVSQEIQSNLAKITQSAGACSDVG